MRLDEETLIKIAAATIVGLLIIILAAAAASMWMEVLGA